MRRLPESLPASCRSVTVQSAVMKLSGVYREVRGAVPDFGRSCLPSRTSWHAATSDQSRWKGRPRGDVERMCAPWRFALRRKSFPAERTYQRPSFPAERTYLNNHPAYPKNQALTSHYFGSGGGWSFDAASFKALSCTSTASVCRCSMRFIIPS